MKTRGIHLVELSKREARTTGLGELLELPQHGLLRSRQTVYDDLHRRRLSSCERRSVGESLVYQNYLAACRT